MLQRRVRFAAVLVVVVLALTGFSTSSSGGKGSKSKSSSGGGCSNSKKSNGSSYRDNDYDDYDDTSSSGSSGGSDYGTPTPTPTASDAPEVRVIRCAQPRKGKRKAVTSSTVRLTPAASGSHTYDVEVTFLDARGNTVSTGEASADVDYGDVKNLTVRMDSPGKVSRVKNCRVTAELRY